MLLVHKFSATPISRIYDGVCCCLDMTHWFHITSLVLLLCHLVGCNPDDCGTAYAAQVPIDCYDCSTFNNGEDYCADPFNYSHPNVRTVRCTAACAKWVRTTNIPGINHYIRTCSSLLNMQMPVSLVCMQESRPGHGHLCFCKKGECNNSNSARYQSWLLHVTVLLSSLWVLSNWTASNIQEEIYTMWCNTRPWTISGFTLPFIFVAGIIYQFTMYEVYGFPQLLRIFHYFMTT
ncbi:unnamed protein product [Owenia fusiformis]|uniref:UPAR/Ly6 domain-containing protein qvr n=1 Tax=Owenia fusiformis TaxID=6347 RepID=A0A8S4N0F0_OWEFU|nr:unnamed protein product [Owenia fusiformis]